MIQLSGEKDLQTLLKNLTPKLLDDDFVFCTMKESAYGDFANLKPIACFVEEEGLTLVLPKLSADLAKIKYDSVFRAITLTVHSSLDAVGLTAAVSNELFKNNISANVIAAFYHDHIFVPKNKATKAMEALRKLAYTG